MKLCVLTLFPSAVDGGTERLVLDQMKLYDSSAYDYFVVALRRGHLDDEYRRFPNFECMRAGLTFNPIALWRVHRFVRSHGIHVLHTHLQEADFYGYLLKLMNRRLVWVSTRHNTDPFRRRLFWRLVNQVTSRLTTHILAVSQAVKDFVVEHERVPADRITVVHNGVDRRQFGQAPPATGLRESLGIGSAGAFVVGSAGRLTEQKGHQYLFEAVARIKDQAPELHLLVLGRGALEGRLRRLAKRLGIADRVWFAGYRGDMAALYSVMDVFCMPSLFEGFGLALVEAMLSGTPVIGTRVDGIKEIIEDDVTGFLVDPADSEGLSRVVLRVYRRQYDRRVTSRARERAIVRFDFETNLRRIEALYLTATANAHRAPAAPSAQARGESWETRQRSASDLRAKDG